MEDMVSIVLIGERAIAQETALLESVITSDGNKAAEQGGYRIWQGEGYTFSYPEGYGVMEQTTEAFS